MKDADILAQVLGTPLVERRFTIALKEIWRQREMAFMQQHARASFCDCLMYQEGDYAAAYKVTSATE
jgi:predicted nucleic-acid-binding protein